MEHRKSLVLGFLILCTFSWHCQTPAAVPSSFSHPIPSLTSPSDPSSHTWSFPGGPGHWSVSGVHSAANCTPQGSQMVTLQSFKWCKRGLKDTTLFFFQVLMCCPHSGRDPDTPTTGLSCVYPRCAHGGEPYGEGAWKCGAARQAEETWGSPFCRQVFFSVFLTFLMCNQKPSWPWAGARKTESLSSRPVPQQWQTPHKSSSCTMPLLLGFHTWESPVSLLLWVRRIQKLSVPTVQLKGLFLRLLMSLDFLSMAEKRRKRALLQNTGVLNMALMFVFWPVAEVRPALGTDSASWLLMVATLLAGG